MDDYRASTYGDLNARDYDAWHQGRHDEETAVEFLAGLAGEGPVLELGVGTGRLAIPLALRGLSVVGVDASEAMLEVLRGKPDGTLVRSVLADFSQEIPGQSNDLVFASNSTFFGLLDQGAQVACFARVIESLAPTGRFVIEALSPLPHDGRERSRVEVLRQTLDETVLETRVHDPVGQTFTTQRVHIGANGASIKPAVIRYCWPSELDLMARLAGAELRERWAGWDRSTFDATSRRHVSVYARREHG